MKFRVLIARNERDRQRGSHTVLRHRHPPHRRLVIPDHDPIATGTLRAHIREQARAWTSSSIFSGTTPPNNRLQRTPASQA